MSNPSPSASAKRPIGDRILAAVEPLVFGRRGWLFALLMVVTALLAWRAALLQPDAGFDKQIPLKHPYMQVFSQYQKAFGGANLISVALMRKDGQEIYDAATLDRLKKLSDAVFFLPGVDRTRVSSLFTPDVTYFEVVEGGINLGNVVPANYQGLAEQRADIRSRVAKANIIGRYISNRQDGGLIIAELLEHHPATGEKLDYRVLAAQMEDQLRNRVQSRTAWDLKLKRAIGPYKAGDIAYRSYTDYGWRLRFQTFEAEQKDADGKPVRVSGSDVIAIAIPNPDYLAETSVHIIGFAKVVGDVTDASLEVVGFFAVTVVVMTLLLWWFCGSLRLAALTLAAGLVAVIWELGLLELCGFGLDPFAILVPFLILSIGVSHGVQYTNRWAMEVTINRRSPLTASIAAFRRLFLPGTVAIITDVIGFGTLAFIQIAIVQEMAINAALGMAAVIITNKVLLPIALSWTRLPEPEAFKAATARRIAAIAPLWGVLSRFATKKTAIATLAVSGGFLAWALVMYPKLTVGDSQTGVPELKPDGRYNQDARTVAANFFIGVDVLKVIGETSAYGCLKHHTMQVLDDYVWHMQNTKGVAWAVALPTVAKEARGLLNENALRWKVLPRNEAAMAQLVGRIPSATGLQNLDCSRLPVFIFTTDHRAETLERVINATKRFAPRAEAEGLKLALASGNAGVMAATNEEIRAREWVVIIWVHLTLAIFVWLSFKSWASVVSIIVPLVLCSLLTYGFMAVMGIGMKAATLPVAAFGVGIGVDDGIYLWGALVAALQEDPDKPLHEAFQQALSAAGKATMFTSLALLIAVASWCFSGLQFQVDMGVLLLFMFGTNLFGALLLMPALAWVCQHVSPIKAGGGLIRK